MERLTSAEFRKKYNYTGGFVDARGKSTGATSSIREDNAETKIRIPTIQALSDLPADYQTEFFDHKIRVDIEVKSKSPADLDNVIKGCMDSLQGYAFKNDRQIREIHARIHDN